MYEARKERPLSRSAFALRLIGHGLLLLALLIVSTLAGMAGYMYFEQLSVVDAFLNTTMLLGGMGPVDPPHTDGGKLFAGFYALYAGLFFLVSAAVMFTPLLHRLLHKFNWTEDER
jgi:hypothetical protein